MSKYKETHLKKTNENRIIDLFTFMSKVSPQLRHSIYIFVKKISILDPSYYLDEAI